MRCKSIQKKAIAKIVVNYFQGKYQNSVALFEQVSATYSKNKLSEKEAKDWEKLLSLFFLGHLVGLNTLNSMLEKHDILSNQQQIKYNSLCKKLSPSVLLKMYETVFKNHLLSKLKTLLSKDKSCLSRELVTVVLDDSIFKHLFRENSLQDPETLAYYGAFFSGQYRASVCGFKVLTLAVVVDGLLYPLFFNFVPKEKKVKEKKVKEKKVKQEQGKKTAGKTALKPTQSTDKLANELTNAPTKANKSVEKEVPAAIKSAENLLTKYGIWREELKKNGVVLPCFHFSCDNGYSHILLAARCEKNGLIYISVPKKNHYFDIDKQRIKLDEFIEKEFLEAEKKHQKQEEQATSGCENMPFVMRKKAIYCAQNQEIILLFFRLNNSKKVSVIYCTNEPNIFGKTLRRHWFNRTYIEQFFRILKHVLRIQASLTRSKIGFEKKLYLFSFMAWHLQNLVRMIRKKVPQFAKRGIEDLQKILSFDHIIPDLLQKIIVKK